MKNFCLNTICAVSPVCRSFAPDRGRKPGTGGFHRALRFPCGRGNAARGSVSDFDSASSGAVIVMAVQGAPWRSP